MKCKPRVPFVIQDSSFVTITAHFVTEIPVL